MINKVMTFAIGLIFALVGFMVLMGMAPTLAGLVTKQFSNNTGYVSNASGCFYKAAVGAGGDVQDTLGLWCLIGTLGPYLIAAGMILVVIALLFGWIKGYIRI